MKRKAWIGWLALCMVGGLPPGGPMTRGFAEDAATSVPPASAADAMSAIDVAPPPNAAQPWVERAQAAARAEAVRRVADAVVEDARAAGGLSAEAEFRLRRAIGLGVVFSDERIDAQGYARATAVLTAEARRQLLSPAPTESADALPRTYAAVGIVAVLEVRTGAAAAPPTGWENTNPIGLARAADAARAALKAELIARAATLLAVDGPAGAGRATGREDVAAVRADGTVDEAIASAGEAATAIGHDAEAEGASAAAARSPGWSEAVWAACTVSPPEYDPCQVCEVRARVSAAAVADVLQSWPALAGVSIVAPPVDEVWTLSGMGMSPWSATLRMDAPGTATPPVWARGIMTAVGQGAGTVGGDAATEGGENQAFAVRAAHIEALLRLSRQVDALALPYPPGATVGDVLASHPADDDVWAAFLRTAWVVETRWSDDVCLVTVAVDLRRLWSLVAPRLENTIVRRPQGAG